MNEELKKRLLELDAKVAQKVGVSSSSAPVAKPTATSTPSYSKDLAELNARVAQKVSTPTAQPQYSTYTEKLATEVGGGLAGEAKKSLTRMATANNPFQGVAELAKLGKVLAQGAGSFVTGALQEGAEQVTKTVLPKQYEPKAIESVRSTFEKIVPDWAVAGGEVESYSEFGSRKQKEIDEDPSSTEWEKKNLAPVLMAGMLLTDWLPGGRAVKSAKSAKIYESVSTLADKKPEVISDILQKNNVTKEVADIVAPRISTAKSIDEVETIIQDEIVRNLQKVNEESGLSKAIELRDEGMTNPKTYDDYLAMSKDRPEVMSKMDKDMLETLTEARKYEDFNDYLTSVRKTETPSQSFDDFLAAKTEPQLSSIYDDIFLKYQEKLPSIEDSILRKNTQTLLTKLYRGDNASLASFLHDGNKISREIFSDLTGLKWGIDVNQTKIKKTDGSFINLILEKRGISREDLMKEWEDTSSKQFIEAPKTDKELEDIWNRAHDKTPEPTHAPQAQVPTPEQPLDFQFGEPQKTIEDTIAEVQKDYTGTRERRWEKKGVLDLAKRLGSGFELPAIFFEKRGLAKTIYNPVRDAQGKAEAARTEILKKFADKGLFKKGGFFILGGFNLSKKEANDMGKYMLSRQGKGYEGYTFEKLTPKTKEMVRTFDEVIAELEPQFRKTAEEMGLDVGKVENYGPLMTKDDVSVVDDGIQPQWLLPYEGFGSTKKRVDDVPLNLYETDYRLIMQRWIHGITDFNDVAPQTKKVKDMLDTDVIKNTLTDKDMAVAQKFISDITTPDVPKTDSGKLAVTANRYARRAQAIAALGYNVKTILKQPLAMIAATVIEKAPPKMRSEYAKAFGVNVKDLPSVSIRGGDINAFNDIRSGSLMQLPFQPLKKVDQKAAEKILNGYLDKEWKAVGKSNALSPEMMAHIEREAQNKLDMLMGGYFPGQRPSNYTSEIGNTLLMFTYPLTSQLNTFFYHVYKGKTTPEKAKRIAEVMTSIALIAYFEQVITNLSFDWDSEEDMIKDVLISASGNIPILGGMVYAAANPGVDYSPIPVVSNINKIKSTAEEGKFEKTAWEVAHILGVPKSFRRAIEGAEVIDEGGAKGFEVNTLPEQIRTAVGGQYGSLAGKEYLEDLNNPKAEDEFKQLKKLTPEEANARYNEIKKTDPSLARSIKKQAEDEKMGITKEDKKIRNMGVEDKERARYIFNRLEDLDTAEEKNAYVSDLQKKKILTKDVKDQLRVMIQSSN
jgi:hypothetical protein